MLLIPFEIILLLPTQELNEGINNKKTVITFRAIHELKDNLYIRSILRTKFMMIFRGRSLVLMLHWRTETQSSSTHILCHKSETSSEGVFTIVSETSLTVDHNRILGHDIQNVRKTSTVNKEEKEYLNYINVKVCRRAFLF